MRPHLIEIENPETQTSIIIDMEGPYHPKKKRSASTSMVTRFILMASHITLRNTFRLRKN